MLIGYARVSTDGQNIDLQIDELKKYGCVKIFSEKSSSRSLLEERDKTISFLDQGDTLVVWKLDRLARSTVELIQIVTELSDRGVNFVSIRDSINTSTAGGKFQLAVFAAVAEFERDIIRERTIAGLAAARARGKIGGRPRGMSKETDSKCQGVENIVRSGGSIEGACRTYKISKSTYYKWTRLRGIPPCKC